MTEKHGPLHPRLSAAAPVCAGGLRSESISVKYQTQKLWQTHSTCSTQLTNTLSGSPGPVGRGDESGTRGTSGSAACCGSEVGSAAWSVAGPACPELCRFPSLDSPSEPQPKPPVRIEKKKKSDRWRPDERPIPPSGPSRAVGSCELTRWYILHTLVEGRSVRSVPEDRMGRCQCLEGCSDRCENAGRGSLTLRCGCPAGLLPLECASCLFLEHFLFLLEFLRRRLTRNSLYCDARGKSSSSLSAPSPSSVGDGEDPPTSDVAWLSAAPQWNTMALGLCFTILSRSEEEQSWDAFTDAGRRLRLHLSVSRPVPGAVSEPCPFRFEVVVSQMMSTFGSFRL
ncbi:hypothetical protein EYF80_038590 [Liparis tanakae]|uniref:Uncharacterized protein n=1 Tax=Liparis tanakae TaxID=230148 RepID=A0A4Z2GCB4_9TELE|nr:hypothetical protein EYF80_038590 [Liparis tanakae]